MRNFIFWRQSGGALLKELNRLSDAKFVSIATPNPEQIVLAKRRPAFAKALSQFDYLLPDGIGLVFASRILHAVDRDYPVIKERIAGVDVVQLLLTLYKEKSQKVLIVGGRNYAGELVRLTKEKELEIGKDIEWIEGYRRAARPSDAEEQALKAKISQFRPEIVFVALGAPHQENWIISYRQFLTKQGVKIAMAVGGSFDILIGRTPRAPKSWQNLGLEWLWRLLQEPWRWQRQLTLVEFAGLVVREAILILFARGHAQQPEH